MNAPRAGILPRDCWAIEGQLERILFPNHNAWPPCLETRRRRPELGQLPQGAIAIHETLDAARRPRGQELPAVEARPLDDAQRLEELRDEVHVRVLTALSKSQGIVHCDSSRPIIQKKGTGFALPQAIGGIETARASATGIGARENGEAPRPFGAAANSEAPSVIVGCSAPLADAPAGCAALLEDPPEDLFCE